MKVIDLIKELEKLPKDATIGSFDLEDKRISCFVNIIGKDTIIYTDGEYTTMEKIETARKSNEGKECDYYIGY